jgi:hypothetical protein
VVRGPFRNKKLFFVTSGSMLAAALLLATAVLAQSGRLEPSPATSSSSSSSAQDRATTTSGAAPDPPPRKTAGLASRVIQWLNEQAPASGGAGGGGEEAAFVAMLDGDCAGTLTIVADDSEGELAEPGRSLYLGAAWACLAAFEGRAKLWPRAEAAFEKIRGRWPALSCESRTVYKLLERLVDIHRAEPQARLIKRAGPIGTLRCPHFARVTPDHGPAGRNLTVLLEGENLPRVVGVNLSITGGNADLKYEGRLTAVSQDGRHLEITIPPGTGPDDSLFLWPDGARFWAPSDGVTFEYDPPETTTRGSTTSTTEPRPTAPTSTTTVPPSSAPATTASASSR